MEALRIADQFYNAACDIRKAYDEAANQLKYFDNEYNDLTHALELTDFGTDKGHKLALQLQANRKNRRRAKEQIECLQPLRDLLSRYQGFIGDLCRATAKVHGAALRQSKRAYSPRVRHELFDDVSIIIAEEL
ncbi:hypothetical protein ACTHSJ_25830 [Paenibacillus cellulositrophicus]|uniref:hypothetical protein n=1 Tax=Paenibacillus cellulositrophicus TaxID=562959 RepID=UPI003F81E428